MSQMHVRPYQQECVQHALKQNTIVNMPTGTGKTLVAVKTIDHFRKTGKVIFLVPTRPLVSQQAEYVRSHSSEQVCVSELQGNKMQNASEAQWAELVKRNDVLVGTSDVFRRALIDTRFLALGSFSLMIFDECHNATGNSPMAAILRDAVHRCPEQQSPRILGLTASFVHGSLEDIEKKRKDLEGLLQAKIFSPEVDEQYAQTMEFERVSYEQSVLPAMEESIRVKTQVLLGITGQYGVPLKDTKDIFRKGEHVFSELGLSAFIYFLRECVAPQVQQLIESAVQHQSGPVHQSTLKKIPELRQAMRDAAERLEGQLTDLPFVTDKASKLLNLLEDLSSQQHRPRVIIFCEQTVLAFPLAHLIQHHLKCRIETCTGVGSMTDGQRKQALERFRSGEIPIMTCTAALEEGLDVSACEVVVRFSHFTTTKSHIQGAGRARAWNAKVYYFDNDPGKELAGAELVDLIAKTESLSLTESEQAECRTHKDIDGVHPFRTAQGAEISIFNCVQMVYEYTAKTMGQSFRPEENMLSYVEDVICEHPRQIRKRLVSAKVPSPDGFIEVSIDMVNEWWNNVGLTDVAEPGRMRNWDSSDKELRRFMYVVAVNLSQRGHLDVKNQPSARALQATRHACEHWKMAPGVKIKAKYDPDGLRGTGVTECQAGQENAKGKLNELTAGAAKYTTILEGTGFRSSVSLPDGRVVEGTSVCTSKKSAEQHVALLALTGTSMPSKCNHQSLAAPSASLPDALSEPEQSTQIFPSVDDKPNKSSSIDTNVAVAPAIANSETSVSMYKSKNTLPAEASGPSNGQICDDDALLAVSSSQSMSDSRPTLVNSSSPTASSSAPREHEQLSPSSVDQHVCENSDTSSAQNAKGQFNELTKGAAKYTTVLDGTGFLSSVTLPDGRLVTGGVRASTKKAAEQHVAALALQSFKKDVETRRDRIDSEHVASSYQDANGQDPQGVIPDVAAIENAKGKVNELTNCRAAYETLHDAGGFRSSVTLPDGKVIHGNTSFATKKAAEQNVAQLALASLQGLVGSSTQQPESQAQENYKGFLVERFPGQAIGYSTQVHPSGGFRSVVSLPDGRSFSGAESATTKKAAEQLAAKAAFIASRSTA